MPGRRLLPTPLALAGPAQVALGPAAPPVARVLPDVAGFERELDYEVPAKFAAELRPGFIVRVPLQGRAVRGWVVAYPVQPPEGLALRPIAKVTGWGPEPELFDLAEWAAWRWAGRRRSLAFHCLAGKRRAGSRLRRPRAVPSRWPGRLRGAGSAADVPLVEEAWSPGTHLLRLPPVYSATEVVRRRWSTVLCS